MREVGRAVCVRTLQDVKLLCRLISEISISWPRKVCKSKPNRPCASLWWSHYPRHPSGVLISPGVLISRSAASRCPNVCALCQSESIRLLPYRLPERILTCCLIVPGIILAGTWSWMSPLSNSIMLLLSNDISALIRGLESNFFFQVMYNYCAVMDAMNMCEVVIVLVINLSTKWILVAHFKLRQIYSWKYYPRSFLKYAK
jgi:hypothetical protein